MPEGLKKHRSEINIASGQVKLGLFQNAGLDLKIEEVKRVLGLYFEGLKIDEKPK